MFIELKFYGRGGQGVVTAANILATAAYYDGLWSQAIPFFGAERRGAPVVSIVRLSNAPVRVHHIVESPDVAVVFDHRLLDMVKLSRKRVLILNSNSDSVKDVMFDSLYILDATSIAIELKMISSGMPIVNTAMLGAVAKAGFVSLSSVIKAIENYWKGYLSKLNAKAATLGYNRTRKVR